MQIGMFIHRLAPPRPIPPSFSRTIPTTISPSRGKVSIQFYTPPNYKSLKEQRRGGTQLPVVVNFHGGGFTLGSATDDARWAHCVVEQTGAVVASVDYRLAPEHPFPTPVEDGVDAVIYLAKYADDLWLDAERIAISGFSSGGNLALTVPLRLWEELDATFEEGAEGNNPNNGVIRVRSRAPAGHEPPTGNIAKDDGQNSGQFKDVNSRTLHPASAETNGSARRVILNQGISTPDFQTLSQTRSIRLRIPAIIAWYPPTDFTISRDQKKETLKRKDMALNPIFTSLFDHSYTPATHVIPHSPSVMSLKSATSVPAAPPSEAPPEVPSERSNPYLSPGVAPTELLSAAIPDNVIFFTCEWDMLQAEAVAFKERLERLGAKRVVHRMIEGVPHGWDKKPNPWQEPEKSREFYGIACKELRRAFGMPEVEGISEVLTKSDGLTATEASTDPKALADQHDRASAKPTQSQISAGREHSAEPDIPLEATGER